MPRPDSPRNPSRHAEKIHLSRLEPLFCKFVGCMLGSALGDAIGELAFKHRNKDALYEAISEASVLRYTDDTAMAIGIAEVLCKTQDLDSASIGNRFKENFERQPWRGYGPGPPMVFSLIDKGYSYSQAASMLFGGSGSFGNGAAMRIGPVGLYFYDSPSLVKKAHITAEVTHAHPLGKDGAAVLAMAIAQAVKFNPSPQPSPGAQRPGQPPSQSREGISLITPSPLWGEGMPLQVKEFCDRLGETTTTPEFSKKISDLTVLLKAGSSRTKAAEILGTDVTAHGSVPYAIFCFLKNRGSFKGCLLDAVLAGGDRDTIGAMACAISGAYLGVNSLPDGWVKKLENVSYIKELAEKLAEFKLKGG